MKLTDSETQIYTATHQPASSQKSLAGEVRCAAADDAQCSSPERMVKRMRVDLKAREPGYDTAEHFPSVGLVIGDVRYILVVITGRLTVTGLLSKSVDSIPKIELTYALSLRRCA